MKSKERKEVLPVTIVIALAIAVIGYFVFGSFTLYLDIQVLFAVILFFGVFLSGKLIQMHMDAKEFYRKMEQYIRQNTNSEKSEEE